MLRQVAHVRPLGLRHVRTGSRQEHGSTLLIVQILLRRRHPGKVLLGGLVLQKRQIWVLKRLEAQALGVEEARLRVHLLLSIVLVISLQVRSGLAFVFLRPDLLALHFLFQLLWRFLSFFLFF